MATLRTRGSWPALEKLLATSALASADVECVAESVRAICAKARGQAVYEVDANDYWEQMLHDRHAAYDMADSVNGAIAYDRDRAVDEVVAIAPGSDSVAYLSRVAECLEHHASRGGEYTTRVLGGLLGDVVKAVVATLPKDAP